MATGIAYSLKLDGIQGENPTKNHTNEIEVISWSWKGSQPVSIGGGGISGGVVKMSDFTISKPVDKSSPKLLNALVTGKHITTGVLSCCKSGTGSSPGDFLTIKLTDIMVSGFHSGGLEASEAHAASIHGMPAGTANKSGGIEGEGMGGTDRETELVSFAYCKVEYDYKIQGKDGSLSAAGTATYDLKTKEGS